MHIFLNLVLWTVKSMIIVIVRLVKPCMCRLLIQGETWIWLGIFGSLLFFIGGLTNLIKVFKMQQMNGMMRLEKLRGGAHERLVSAREGRVPLILDHHQPIINHQPISNRQLPEETKVDIPLPTPYKDVLIGVGRTKS
jgi:polypyrimidine tract-binding protein 2